ncbi:MAG: hypothetical protein LUE87_06155 [Lachnospiraceae bacterium]|nr:hypothetical protein [Lachnospiraceae bacterium]
MNDAEKLRQILDEAEKEMRLKAQRSGCGTPKRLADVLRPIPELEQYLGKKE